MIVIVTTTYETERVVMGNEVEEDDDESNLQWWDEIKTENHRFINVTTTLYGNTWGVMMMPSTNRAKMGYQSIDPSNVPTLSKE